VAARRIDARFLLPFLPRTALVLGELPGVREGLADAGLEELSVSAAPGVRPDLVITDANQARRACAVGARGVLLEGSARRVASSLSAAKTQGLAVSCVLPLPSVQQPHLLVPLRHRALAGYALQHWAPAGGRRTTSLKLAVARRLVAAGLLPPTRERVGVAVAPEPSQPVHAIHAPEVQQDKPSSSTLPAVLGAAAQLGLLAPDAGWFASFPPGPDRKRCAFLVAQPEEESSDQFVVKFARLPGVAPQFDRDQRGLALAAATGGAVARASQRLLARFEVAGHQASVETAARGSTLELQLARPASRTQKVALVEAVGTWLLRVAAETARRSEDPGPELARLRGQVLPFWSLTARSEELLAGLAEVPAVFEHGDVSEGNVMIDGDDLALVDWELARSPGHPLWDLLYFASCVLPLVDGATDGHERDGYFVALFEGRAKSSPLLFRWVRSAVATLGLSPLAVGSLATLCWLHWGELLHRLRQEQDSAEPPLPVERAARLWLANPRLSQGWDRWLVQ
jgi:hypothetical protein